MIRVQKEIANLNMKGVRRMKALNKFMEFNWERFSTGKEFTVTECTSWTDYNTHETLGTRIEVIITKDETDYNMKNGNETSNLYQRLIFKVTKNVNVDINSKIVPINPVVKAYGLDRDGKFSSYLNCLSIQCEDVATA